jgi:hypothetical protein
MHPDEFTPNQFWLGVFYWSIALKCKLWQIFPNLPEIGEALPQNKLLDAP